jgi:putative phosphoesterase
MKQRSAILIGVIADTHGLFDPAVRRHFKGVDHIFHAGDIGKRSVVEQLEQLAPVTAVSGNIDVGELGVFPSETVIELAGRRIAIRHILYKGGKLTECGRAFLQKTEPDICIFGHTHQPKTEWFGKTFLFNPGSAGPKRFSLPRGIGLLTIRKEKALPTLIRLSDNVNHRNSSTGVKLPKKKGGTR